METKDFKKLFEHNCENLNLEKFKTAFFTESNDSVVFLILRKSSYSKKYYFRVKTHIKPLENSFDKNEFIKHDISNILLSLDSEYLEIFDLENQLTDLERRQKMKEFFINNVANWIKILLSKNAIIEKFTEDNLFLLPYTKSKLGMK